MKKILASLSVFGAMFLLPAFAFAQQTSQDIFGLTNDATGLVLQVTKFLVAAAVLVFIYGVVKYIIAGDEEGKANAQKIILYGVIGLFAIVAVWGLVTFLSNSTGVGNDAAPGLPCPPGFASC